GTQPLEGVVAVGGGAGAVGHRAAVAVGVVGVADVRCGRVARGRVGVGDRGELVGGVVGVGRGTARGRHRRRVAGRVVGGAAGAGAGLDLCDLFVAGVEVVDGRLAGRVGCGDAVEGVDDSA